jgi:tetracycline 7-halogenase / FADH2 O2-dependent halogenase
MREQYDVLIVGSGIAGSSVAMALARVGITSCVLERETHPRFVIGESTVPSTTLGYDYLAGAYSIPEFNKMSHYLGLKELGLVGYPKQHFYFGHHTPGQPMKENEELMYETLQLPMGPDVHVLRSDTDHYLVKQLPSYGVDYFDQTEVIDFKNVGEGVALTVKSPEGTRDIKGRLVVDASGHASYFAKKYGMRDPEPRLKTRTRSIFGHFENVPSLEDVVGKSNPAFRFKRHGGTQHHCFEGGWIWVIPFDNGVTSVGLQLDPDMYPIDESLTPEQELQKHFDRFPTVKAHLGNMKPIRKVIRTPTRIQFTSKTILGDGFILTPHAAGFIDPLFSTGITLTQSFVSRFVPVARKVFARPGKIDTAAFRNVEVAFMKEVETIDNLVSAVMKSWGHYDTFKQAWRIWGLGTIIQYTARMVGNHARAEGCTLMFGSAIDPWRQAVKEMNELVLNNPRGPETAARLKAMLDKWPHPHNFANYELNSERSCSIAIEDPGYYFRWLGWFVSENAIVKEDRSIFRLLHWGARFFYRFVEQRLRYRFGASTAYKKGFEYIAAIRTPRARLPMTATVAPHELPAVAAAAAAMPSPSQPSPHA